jgi:anti-sigma factor RsiW
MDHRAVQESFSAYLEGDLPPEEQTHVAAHLETCEECRKELAAFQQTLKRLASLRPLAPPEGFSRRVQQRIHRRSRGRFFKSDRLLMRVPFEWISFVLIIIMLVLYMLLLEGEARRVQPEMGGDQMGTGIPRSLPHR